MANEILQSFGFLNNFLAQEVARTKQERKDEVRGQVAANIADQFGKLPSNASDADIKSVTLNSMKLAALSNTLDKNQPLINSLHEQAIMTEDRAKKNLTDKLLYEGLSSISGMKADPALGGLGMKALLDYQMSSTKMGPGANEQGQTTAKQFAWKNGGWVDINKDIVTGEMTSAQKNQQALDLYAAKERISFHSQAQLANMRNSIANDYPKPMTGKVTKDGKPLFWTPEDGPVTYTQDENGNPVTEPYFGGAYPSTDPAKIHLAELRTNIALGKATRDQLNAVKKQNSADAEALMQDLINTGVISEAQVRTQLTGKDVSSGDATLGYLLETKKKDLVEKIKDKFTSPSEQAAVLERLSMFEETYKMTKSIDRGELSNLAGQDIGKTKQDIEHSKILKDNNLTQKDWNRQYNNLNSYLGTPGTASYEFLANLVRAALPNKFNNGSAITPDSFNELNDHDKAKVIKLIKRYETR